MCAKGKLIAEEESNGWQPSREKEHICQSHRGLKAPLNEHFPLSATPGSNPG